MLIGITAGFGHPLGDDLDLVHALGFGFVRQEFRAHRSDAEVRRLLAEFRSSPVAVLALLGGGRMESPSGGRVEPHVLAAHGARVVRIAADLGVSDLVIEVGNEPDLAHADYQTRPQDFAMAIRYTFDAVRDAGFTGRVVTGGISNLSEDGLEYLERMLESGLPEEAVLGFHRYPRGMGPRKPQEGFDSRDAEWEALMRLAGRRKVACTELGHHTAPRPTRLLGLIPVRRRVTEEEVADHVTFDLEFFAARGCLLTAIYQLNDGSRPDVHLDRYGIRRQDGSLKPVALRISQISRSGFVR